MSEPASDVPAGPTNVADVKGAFARAGLSLTPIPIEDPPGDTDGSLVRR